MKEMWKDIPSYEGLYCTPCESFLFHTFRPLP